MRLTYNGEILVGCEGNSSTQCYEKQVGSSGVKGYILKQSIPFNNVVISVDVDRDAMVRREHISIIIQFFVRRNHVWEKVNKIDGSTFDTSIGYSVALSGNITLIALEKNVYLV